MRDYASVLFTVDYGLTLLILGVFAHVIASEAKQLVEQKLLVRCRFIRTRLLALTAIVVLSLVAPWDWNYLRVHIRPLIWYVPIISFWFNQLKRGPVGGFQAQCPA